MANLTTSKGFVNPAFATIYNGITAQMPGITFWGIVATYLITAALNVHFIPLPVVISIPAALAIQFGRFAVVFMDFLNPRGYRSPWPGMIATVATVVALVELWFSLSATHLTGHELWAVYLFGGMVIALGFLMEINFISKGAEAFGMVNKPSATGALQHTGMVAVNPRHPQPDYGLAADEVEAVNFHDAAALLREAEKAHKGNGMAEVAAQVKKSTNGNGNH